MPVVMLSATLMAKCFCRCRLGRTNRSLAFWLLLHRKMQKMGCFDMTLMVGVNGIREGSSINCEGGT
jgi:hypothetical protein